MASHHASSQTKIHATSLHTTTHTPHTHPLTPPSTHDVSSHDTKSDWNQAQQGPRRHDRVPCHTRAFCRHAETFCTYPRDADQRDTTRHDTTPPTHPQRDSQLVLKNNATSHKRKTHRGFPPSRLGNLRACFHCIVLCIVDCVLCIARVAHIARVARVARVARGVLRVECCVLRVACCVLRVAFMCCVLCVVLWRCM